MPAATDLCREERKQEAMPATFLMEKKESKKKAQFISGRKRRFMLGASVLLMNDRSLAIG
jgi:hypothetical protein